MMRWWLDRGVDGFRMDVVNMISKDVAPDGHLHDGPPLPGSSLGDGSASYLCGPRIHEFVQEMHREVFAGREGAFLTVGEMPGVTVEEARLFTDPARSPASATTARSSAGTRPPAWRPCCTCTGGRRTSTRARRSGWRTTRSPP